MALGEERFVGLAADFEGKLRMKNAILFIGRNMKEDVVRQIIGLYPWKIIATSRNTLPLEELQGIHIKIYSDEGDITAANLWKNDEFPVVYVWKKDESLNEEECQTLEITGESEEEYRVRRAQGMMKRLCKMIDNHNAMVVVGYAPETDNDMPYRAFATAVYNDCAIADNIQFWSEKSEETKLKKLADLKGIEFHTESLDEVLKARYEWNQSDEVKSNDSDAQYEIFYKNGKAVTISSREFLPYRKLAFPPFDKRLICGYQKSRPFRRPSASGQVGPKSIYQLNEIVCAVQIIIIENVSVLVGGVHLIHRIFFLGL